MPIPTPDLVAFCGLYCGACKRFLQGKCSGCRESTRTSWCQVRHCCQAEHYSTCAECIRFDDVRQCPKFTNLFSKFFALLFNSNRSACIQRIQAIGEEKFALEMHEKGWQTIPRKQKKSPPPPL